MKRAACCLWLMSHPAWADDAVKLRELIVAEKFPGVTKQADLFRDPIGHGLGHVQALAAYCNFAAIYRRSPQGLKLTEPGVDNAQHAILQRIAWETVSKYAYSGIEQRWRAVMSMFDPANDSRPSRTVVNS